MKNLRLHQLLFMGFIILLGFLSGGKVSVKAEVVLDENEKYIFVYDEIEKMDIEAPVRNIVKIKNGRKEVLVEEVTSRALVKMGNNIYYSKIKNKKNKIYKMNLKTKKTSVVTSGKNFVLLEGRGRKLFIGEREAFNGMSFKFLPKVYLYDLKTKKKKVIAKKSGLNFIKVYKNRIMFSGYKTDTSNTPSEVFDWSGKKIFSVKTVDAFFYRNRLYYSQEYYQNHEQRFRFYSCDLNGKKKKELKIDYTKFGDLWRKSDEEKRKLMEKEREKEEEFEAVNEIDYIKDSNQDGIADYYNTLIKEGKLALKKGDKQFVGIDFNYNKYGVKSDDYDGDGLLNGDELQVLGKKDEGKVSLAMPSNPLKKNYLKNDYEGLIRDGQFAYAVAGRLNEEDKGIVKIFTNLYEMFSVDLTTSKRKDIYLKILKEYLENDAANIQDLRRKEELIIYDNILTEISEKIGNLDDNTKLIGWIGELKEGIDDLDEASAKKLKDDYNKSLVKVQENMGKVLKAMNKKGIKVDFGKAVLKNLEKLGDKSKVNNKIFKGMDILDTAVKIKEGYDKIKLLAEIRSNQKFYEKNKSILEKLMQSENKSMSMAATEILVRVKDDMASLGVILISETVENEGYDALKEIVKKGNIQAIVADITREITSEVLNVEEDVNTFHEMQAYYELGLAMIQELKENMIKSKEDDILYYSKNEKEADERLTDLAQIRILGEEKYAKAVKVIYLRRVGEYTNPSYKDTSLAYGANNPRNKVETQIDEEKEKERKIDLNERLKGLVTEIEKFMERNHLYFSERMLEKIKAIKVE